MLSIRPVESGDVLDYSPVTTKIVKTKGRTKTYTEYSSAIAPFLYDKAYGSIYNGHVSDGVYNNSYFLPCTKLNFPISVVNTFITDDYGTLKKLFSTDKELAKDIVSLCRGSKYLRILSKEERDDDGKSYVIESFPDTRVTYDSKIHRIGGDAVRHVLREFDVEEAIRGYIIESLTGLKGVKSLIRNITKEYKDLGFDYEYEIDVEYFGATCDEEDYIHVFDGWWFTCDCERLFSYLKSRFDSGEYYTETGLLGSVIHPLVVMKAFNDDNNKFINMCMDFCVLLPIGYRETVRERIHPLTELYDELTVAATKLDTTVKTSNVTLNSIRIEYSTLVRKFREVVEEAPAYKGPQYKSLKQTLTGKEGVIRGSVCEAKVDFSGRAVITTDYLQPVDTVVIPKKMAVDLFGISALRDDDECKYRMISSSKNQKELCNRITNPDKGDGVTRYAFIGRQPSLHMHSAQGFKVKFHDSDSISIHPSITPAFNADFDGDQMRINAPQTQEAIDEVKNIMANSNNIFYSKDGTCMLYPRQEVLYGLNRCQYATPNSNSAMDISDKGKLFEMLDKEYEFVRSNVNTPVIVGGVEYPTLGNALLKCILGSHVKGIVLGVVPIIGQDKIDKAKSHYEKLKSQGYDVSAPLEFEEKKVSEKFFTEYIRTIYSSVSREAIMQLIYRLYKLGFASAYINVPNVSMLNQVDNSKLFEEFEKRVAPMEEKYNLGFEPKDSLNAFYLKEAKTLSDNLVKNIVKTLGPDNGFVSIIESGARGSKSNLRQLMGMKGTVMKDATEAFNFCIKKSLSDQLTGLEHFITAYGGRDGLIDKTINTFTPGYLYFKMSSAGRHIKIRSHDCGTKRGLHLTYQSLKEMMGNSLDSSSTGSIEYNSVKRYAIAMMEGRYFIEFNTPSPTSKEVAEQIFTNNIATLDSDGVTIHEHEGVHMRTAIYCDDLCCVKCYGKDLVTQKPVLVNTAVGIIAAQSIGEPGTQMTMKNFQSGGVSGNVNLTSSFDIVSSLFELGKVTQAGTEVDPYIHDFISPVTGMIVCDENSGSEEVKELQIFEYGSSKPSVKGKFFSMETRFKDYVQRGESVLAEKGLMNIREIISIRGIDAAIDALVSMTYNIFYKEVFVNRKHFEIIVSSMILHLALNDAENSEGYFKAGSYYSTNECQDHNTEGVRFMKTLVGLKRLARFRQDFLTGIYLEDVKECISRNILVSGKDEFKDPLVRLTNGLTPYIGTDSDEYKESRR